MCNKYHVRARICIINIANVWRFYSTFTKVSLADAMAHPFARKKSHLSPPEHAHYIVQIYVHNMLSVRTHSSTPVKGLRFGRGFTHKHDVAGAAAVAAASVDRTSKKYRKTFMELAVLCAPTAKIRR